MGVFDKNTQNLIAAARAYQEAHPEIRDDEPDTQFVVKCPTCGSTHTRKISSSEKVGNIIAFGIYGNKRRKQFKCLDCSYMW